MFRHIVQLVTGIVSPLRHRFQKSSGPFKGKQTATASTKKPTKRQQSPVRAVKKASQGGAPFPDAAGVLYQETTRDVYENARLGWDITYGR